MTPDNLDNPDYLDDWVKTLNSLAVEMDEIAAAVHPSTLMSQTENLRSKYRKLAQKMATK